MRYLALLLIVAASLPAQHQGAQPARPAAEDSAASPYFGNLEAIAEGQTHFMSACSGCHGPTGEGGRGPSLLDSGNARQASNSELFDWIQKGIPGTDMPPSNLPDEHVWQIAAFVRNLSAPAYDQPLPGDPKAGRAVFFGKGGCDKCHMVRGQGGLLGPDLSDAGAYSKQVQIREAVVDPNKRITAGFTPVEVKFKDGREVKGVAKNYSNYSMQLLDNKGELHLIATSDLENVVFRAKSWMPGDYSSRLSETELNDLIAFLSRQVIRVPRGDERDAEGRLRRRDDN